MKKMNILLKKYKLHLIEGGLCVMFGVLVGYMITPKAPSLPSSFPASRANDSKYKFTNPLLSCNLSDNKEFTEYKPLENRIDGLNESNNVVSVYYRDLNSGHWFSVNENEKYSPASLFKVPTMIAYLKLAEENPSILTTSLYYPTSEHVPDNFSNNVEFYKSKGDITPGAPYTVDQLISSMIINSDNVASNILFSYMDKNSLEDVLSDFGLKLPPNIETTSVQDFVDVKEYSYVFRLLYNSTYLDHEMSEKALDLLTRTTFDKGIVAGVPKGVVVAHKFGERTYTGVNTTVTRELHDCGIVYYPNHPYLLCVMTKGKDFNDLASSIQQISSTTYKYVDKEY
jgi:beta-lactamase class A